MPQEIQHFGDQFLQSDKFDFQFLPSRKGEQPRSEGSTALGALDGPVQQTEIRGSCGTVFFSRLRLPNMTANRLLKSCATPPVSCPMLSIFWDS